MSMMRLTLAMLSAFLLSACSQEPASQPAATSTVETSRAEARTLHELVEAYFEQTLELNPVRATVIGDNRYNDRYPNDIGAEHRARELALERDYLAQIEGVDLAALSPADRLTAEVFRRDRQTAIEGFTFPSHLLPVSQFFSPPNFFAQMGSGSGVHPFKSVKDYEDFLSRMRGFARWADQAVVNMREGVERGVVQPRILMERTLPQLAAHIVDEPEQSIFYRPVQSMPSTLEEAERTRLASMYRHAISETVVPAYRRLHDFIRDEYMAHTRETVGLAALPDGARWYGYLVRRTTTTDLTPNEIHDIGLREVERIHGEMRKVMTTVGFEGDLNAFFDHLNSEPRFYYDTREELVQAYRDLKDRVAGLAPKLFSLTPAADFEVRAVEPFRERSASGASYQRPAPDGSRAGIFYVNTYDVSARPAWGVESLYLHEAVPGHHFQIALQQEQRDLPRFRRFGGYTAYIEGWALYAESLGKELGVYTDPYQYFGSLAAELWRAIRLVVDTGLHHEGWTRERVLDYMYANTAVKEARAVSEAERYIAIPSQALAYKIGQIKITELRARARRELGERFDVRDFHAQILQDGALPLDVLERKITRWIEAQSGA